jgi:predicted Ser/Thr protein kinase
MWYTSRGGVENAFKVDGKFNSVIRTPRINFHGDTQNALLTVREEGGSGIIENPMINNEEYITDKSYKEYLTGTVITPKK